MSTTDHSHEDAHKDAHENITGYPWETTSPDDPAPASTGGRHPVHVAHLVMGLVLAGLAAVWALVQADLVHGGDLRWLLPLPWVVAGSAGLLVAVLGGRRRQERAEAARREEYRRWLEAEQD
ncbi:hypothetical protein [Nocardioides sp. GY 10127]|uniref:hypothetical protein n=1 Tax=Nocardioides sp. GY 10127 TaxID=2569762 RepID=UPI0010A779B5|nr:hypothetical protein [Nocardioides sp. GY 10127]TIC84323.1 hypothetical protein E8D37_06005 [Nocardioides sp. GY 10127]